MLQRLWLRVRAFIARVFRREVAPGHFEAGHASSLRGLLTTAPLVAPSRDYLVYIPRGHSRLRRAPLIVLCHGCRQTPEDIAGLTRITEHADRNGALVLVPRQVDGANAYRCWNWFEANTSHGGGEAAIVAKFLSAGFACNVLYGSVMKASSRQYIAQFNELACEPAVRGFQYAGALH